jgi:hypothetical protein
MPTPSLSAPNSTQKDGRRVMDAAGGEAVALISIFFGR